VLVSFEARKYSTLHLFNIWAGKSTASPIQENKKERGIEVPYFFAMVMNSSVVVAGKLVICTVPRAPSSTERRARFDNVDKVVWSKHRVLGDDFCAKMHVHRLLKYSCAITYYRGFGKRGLSHGRSLKETV
jgi:hypothetical protein